MGFDNNDGGDSTWLMIMACCVCLMCCSSSAGFGYAYWKNWLCEYSDILGWSCTPGSGSNPPGGSSPSGSSPSGGSPPTNDSCASKYSVSVKYDAKKKGVLGVGEKSSSLYAKIGKSVTVGDLDGTYKVAKCKGCGKCAVTVYARTSKDHAAIAKQVKGKRVTIS